MSLSSPPRYSAMRSSQHPHIRLPGDVTEVPILAVCVRQSRSPRLASAFSTDVAHRRPDPEASRSHVGECRSRDRRCRNRPLPWRDLRRFRGSYLSDRRPSVGLQRERGNVLAYMETYPVDSRNDENRRRDWENTLHLACPASIVSSATSANHRAGPRAWLPPYTARSRHHWRSH